MHGFLTVLALLLALASPLRAQPTPVSTSWELASLPGGGLVAVLWLTPGQGYKTYGNEPSEAGMPTRVQATLTPRGTPLPVLYPPGKATLDLFEKDKTVAVYDGPTPIFVPLPADAPPEFGLEAKVSLLACTDTSCWPMSIETTFSSKEAPSPAPADKQPWWGRFADLARQSPSTPVLESVAKAAPAATDWTFSPRSASPRLEVNGLLKALPLAFLAGFILNLMPCVLPVACLKLSSLLAACSLDQGCDRHAKIRSHNVFFALGILAYFCVMAVVLGAAEMAWGQLFQQPGLILGAAAVLFSMGLSLFGVFHLPVVDLKIGARPGHSPKTQALATGFLATLLATPCSGPFLGGVLAWTLLQPVAVVMTVFVGIGVGMASPYLVLAARPELTRFVPRPGAWMNHLEKLAGFLIMATCLYFLTILPQALLLPALAALLATAFACHAWGAWTNLSQGPFTRWAIRTAAMALAVGACFWALTPPAPETAVWRPFDKAAFNQALGKENLLLDFTADWCPTCKALEKTVLAGDAVAKLQKRHGFIAMRVDLTREDPEAMALLRALGSASIPVAAAFPKGEEAKKPVVLRDLFTSGQLGEALKEAFGEGK
ncbi:protein-disulfide reductase DsbD family protein [Fundidesulfovibrio terrae]|uniref:protein-disulfide reductase DsbD family protein n=1 Tax=Fundidesulfovibrio terrae TaxID=2922866 RepID=UPI001FB031DB|nr:cytochrome c biogenesis protein CcdA [Fundidesulfovibrio terrae]